MNTDPVTRINEYLALSKKHISCTACGKDICPAGADWRRNAVRRERLLSEVVPLVSEHPGVFLEEFICPGCGTMLETRILVKNHAPGTKS